jgi:hypothetical protein
MALSKEVSYDYEIRGEYKFIQERAKTAIVEDGSELSSSYHRRVLTPDADVSGENSEVQALASAVWTDEVKAAYEASKE